jgi:multisubunit Na+/H+ antiporter MnhF subunit
VNPWIVAAMVLMVLSLAPLWVCLRAPIMDALVALELCGVLQTGALLLLGEGFHRGVLFDPALVLALLTLLGTLLYARMLERRV